MARVIISNWASKTLEVNNFTRSLLQHFHDHQLDWMHACGGKGRCTTCKVIVRQGMDQFTALTPAELRYRAMGALQENERLSCQSRIKGDVVIEVPDEYKLPHVHYDR